MAVTSAAGLMSSAIARMTSALGRPSVLVNASA